MTTQAIEHLKQQARSIQKALNLLIENRVDPAAFGRLSREQENIYREIDAMGKIDITVPDDGFADGGCAYTEEEMAIILKS